MGGKVSRIVGLAASAALIIAMVPWAIGLTIAPVVAAESVRVTVSAPEMVIPGGTFTVTVNITQVQNFDATNYDVSFNPAVLQLADTDNVTSGNIGGTKIPVDAANQISPGTVRIVQNVPGLNGANGFGYLAQLRFRVVGSANQTSNIILTNGVLSNNLATAIPADWVGSSVRVVSPPPSGQGTPPSGSSPSSSSPPDTSGSGSSEPAPSIPEAPTSPTTPASSETPGIPPPAAPTLPPSSGTPGASPIVPSPSPTSAPQPEVSATSPVAPGAVPAPPPSQTEPVNPLLVWGVIGGMVGIAVVVGLIILQMRRARY